MTMRVLRWVAVLLVGLAVPVRADVRLPAILSDHMVLQRAVAVPIWGWAEAGEKVTVKIPGQTKTATADAQGRWMVKLDALKAGGPHQMTVTATNTLTVSDVHKHLRVPVGLINASVGGTPIENWTPASALEDPAFKATLDEWRRTVGASNPGSKILPFGTLHNGMIAPLVPYTLRGALWYQGERNCRMGTQWLYRKLLPALIGGWRKAWGRDDLPFLYVQLPNWRGHHRGVDDDWAIMRESMAKVLAVPGTGMAVAIDVGDSGNIHPKNKQAVGARLALAARAVAYGETLIHSGPLFESMAAKGGNLCLRFKHVGEGLVAKGGKLTGFTIAGADRKFVPAQAVIEGETVIVTSPEVMEPLAVRYGWANDPKCSLYNKAGLPASPFRTDEWPVRGQPGYQPDQQ